MENPDIAKIYSEMGKRPLTEEEINALSQDFLEKTKGRIDPLIKVETISTDPETFSWTMKITVPAGFLDPDIEAEWRRKNELEKAQSKAAGSEG